MTSNATTRATRTAQGKCAVCLQRPATKGLATCPTCRKASSSYTTTRYAQRRKAKQCVLCGASTDGAYLCEEHAAARRKRRMRESTAARR